MPTYNPIIMYPTSTAAFGVITMECYAVGGSAQTDGPFLRGGNLYSVMQSVNNPPGNIYVVKSTDQGATWTILDLVNSPQRHITGVINAPTAGAYWDGVDTLTVAYNAGSLTVGGPIKLQTFDLVNEIWGPLFGTSGAPIVNAVNQMYIRPDGTLIVLTNRIMSGFSAVGIRAFILASGVWSAPFNVDTNITIGFISNASSSTVIDLTTGIIHLFGRALSGGTPLVWYQQILANNTLGPYENFGATFLPTFSGKGNPIIVGANLLLGVVDSTDTYPTLLLGTPLAAPVFSVLSSPGIDPGFPGAGSTNTLQPTLASDGTNIFAVYLFFNTGFTGVLVRLAQTVNIANPLLGWSGSEIYDGSTGTILNNSGQYPSLSAVAGQLMITVQANAPGEYYGQPTAYWMMLGSTPLLSDPWFHLFT